MLTDKTIKNTKAKAKPFRLPDSGGLFLYVTPAGGRFWRYRYERKGAEQTLSIGEYPEVSLAEARDARNLARKAIRAGISPVPPPPPAPKPQFSAVMTDWLKSQAPAWADRHALKVKQSLIKWAIPVIGTKPIDTITPADIADVLQLIEDRGAQELLRQVRERLNRVCLYARRKGLIAVNPAQDAGQGAAPQIKGRHPAIVDIDELRNMLAAVDAGTARPVTRLALRLLALTGVRQGELRIATWDEFHGLDGEKPEWRVPIAHMKIPRAKRLGLPAYHVVPLSTQAVAVIRVLQTLTGLGPLPFPSAVDPHRPMSENAIGELLIRAGYKDRHVPHGFRSSFSTIMNEREPGDRLMIDYMLGHKLKDQVEGAYNRAAYMVRRRALAQEWADLVMADAPSAEAIIGGLTRPRAEASSQAALQMPERAR